jgi:SNF2 family DNA or RNA helicase
MLRRVRGEVLKQLPPRRDVRVSVAMSDAQEVAHDELARPIADLANRARRRPLTQAEFLRLMQLLTQQRMICNGLALRDFADVWPTLEASRRRSDRVLATLESPKLVELRDLVEDLAVTQQRKIVVFSQWRRMLKLAAWATGAVLERAGVRAAFFTGEESQRRRGENLVAFHDDPATRVLFATDAGGVGLNLQRAASCCINLELPWNPAVLEQRIGRIFRLGQTQPVEIYNLTAASGIEDRIAGLVSDKRALFTGLFDGTSDEVPFDSAGSFMRQVQEIVRPATAPDDATIDSSTDDADAPALELVADEVESEPPAAGLPPAKVSVEVGDLTSVMSQIEIRPLDDGRVALELPRAAASALGGLLRALAAAVEGTPAVH